MQCQHHIEGAQKHQQQRDLEGTPPPGLDHPAGKQLIDETCDFFSSVGGQADRTNVILTDIMMAQDFHDLTGQVIRRVVALAQSLEEQLLKLVIETSPPGQRPRLDQLKLEGPVVVPDSRDDVVADQKGVDDLLASLGF